MTAQEVSDRLARVELSPFFKNRGFKRTSATFHRSAGANWQVISFQKSRYSDAREVRFTVNVSVAIDRLRERPYDWPPGKRPAESSCQMRNRLGQLMGSPLDAWWTVTPDTDPRQLADALERDLEHYALPWLETYSDDDRLIDLVRGNVVNQPVEYLYWFQKLALQLGDARAAERIQQLRALDAAAAQQPL